MFGVKLRNGLPPLFRHGNSPRWGLFLMFVLAANVAVAILAWFIVGLVLR
jgi:apolipoprotein N-acyltransferase